LPLIRIEFVDIFGFIIGRIKESLFLGEICLISLIRDILPDFGEIRVEGLLIFGEKFLFDSKNFVEV
jgi:hypothetical protein